MQTGFTEQVKQFDEYIKSNYSMLRTASQNICWGDSTHEDILQDNLIKVRERITKSGWTSTTYSSSGYGRSVYSYLYRSIDNDFKLKKKRDTKRSHIDFDESTIQNELLEYFNGMDHNSQSYYDNLEQFIKYLFEYIETRFDHKKATLFKTYFLTPANTYKKLAEHSGLSEKYIREVISNMKRQIKNDLINYIKECTQKNK